MKSALYNKYSRMLLVSPFQPCTLDDRLCLGRCEVDDETVMSNCREIAKFSATGLLVVSSNKDKRNRRR